MRSSWDEEATHFSFKSSPAGGHKQWKTTWELDEKFGWRTRSLTHYHVDFNNFILMHSGASLVIDEGFNRTSRAEIHNLITVDGTGCVGEKIWEKSDLSDPELFDLNCKGIHNVWRYVPKGAVARVEAFSSDDGFVHVVGEASKMYYLEMQLTRNARYVINSECGYFIIVDELESELPHSYTLRIHSEQFARKSGPDQYQIVNGKGVLDIHTLYPENSPKTIDETIVEEIMTPQRPNDKRRISLKTLKVENAEKSKDLMFMNVLAPHDFFGGKSLSIERVGGADARVYSSPASRTASYSSSLPATACAMRISNWKANGSPLSRMHLGRRPSASSTFDPPPRVAARVQGSAAVLAQERWIRSGMT